MKNKIALLKGLVLLILLVWTSANSAKAQSCLPNGITFNSQAQIDAFATNYPGCTEILGKVSISESSAGNIVNLNGLSQITSMGGTWERVDVLH